MPASPAADRPGPSGWAATTVSSPSVGASQPRRRLWAAARLAAIAAIVAGSAAAVYAERATISSGLASFRQSSLGWVVAGFGAECVSMAAFVLLQHALVSRPASAAAAGLIVLVLHSPRGRARLRPPATVLVRLSQRLVHRPAGDPATIAAGILRRLGSFNLGPAAIAAAFGYALMNWAADAACLAAAIAAIGVSVPWDKLLLVWSAGAAAASFSPTPYGLGVVDIALITALTRAGLASPEAVGAVLLYRIITFKILVTFGWIGYRRLQDHIRRVVR